MTSIRDKIQKLLALAQGAGATEFEAARALELASALMLKHGIELDAINPKGTVLEGDYRPSQGSWERYLTNAISLLYGVKAIYTSDLSSFRFIGRPEHIEIAEDSLVFLVNQVQAFYKQVLPRGLSTGERAKFRKSFKAACAHRLLERSKAILKEQTCEASSSNALVVIDYRQKLSDEVAEYLGDSVKTLPFSVTHTSPVAAALGRTAGDKIHLQRPLD